MRLHEEYIKRHDLNVPVVRYDGHSSIFLKSKDYPFRLRIFSIRWHDGGYHPGFFEATYTTPCHNGYEGGDLLKHLMRSKRLYWDEYEDWVLTMTGTLKEEFVAVPFDEHHLIPWQMFLVMYDAYLAKGMNSDFFSVIEDTIRGDLSISERANNISVAETRLYACMPDAYESWKYQVRPLSNTHSEWLEKLINE